MNFFNSIEEAIIDLQKGQMVIVVDDEDRENEGDFVMAASKVTPQDINFMTTIGRGLVCAPLCSKRAEKLKLNPMVKVDNKNTSKFHTAFTVSVDFIAGNTTGISSFERARTLNALANDDCIAEDFMRPGHIFPLIAKDGGVLERPGHTEATVELLKLAQMDPVGVICEILSPTGHMSRGEELQELARTHQLKIITIKSLIEYIQRLQKHQLTKIETVQLPTIHGDFELHLFQKRNSTENVIAITKGDIHGAENLLLRLHSQCATGDIFGSLRCDCQNQLIKSLKRIEESKNGMLIYLEQEGRGIGLVNKIRSYKLQESGLDTVSANRALGFDADLRNYHLAAEVLHFFSIQSVRLMTNNPDKIKQLQREGIEVKEREALEVPIQKHNFRYMHTKHLQMGHMFNLD